MFHAGTQAGREDARMKPDRIITPTGHLGTTPLEKASFERGCAAAPDFIVADSGSADIGPYPLGADRAASDEVWQRHDVEAMLLASRRLRIPLIIGSASDTGTDRGVDQYVRLVREIAVQHRLAPSQLATIYSETSIDDVRRPLKDGGTIPGPTQRDDLVAARPAG